MINLSIGCRGRAEQAVDAAEQALRVVTERTVEADEQADRGGG